MLSIINFIFSQRVAVLTLGAGFEQYLSNSQAPASLACLYSQTEEWGTLVGIRVPHASGTPCRVQRLAGSNGDESM